MLVLLYEWLLGLSVYECIAHVLLLLLGLHTRELVFEEEGLQYGKHDDELHDDDDPKCLAHRHALKSLYVETTKAFQPYQKALPKVVCRDLWGICGMIMLHTLLTFEVQINNKNLYYPNLWL